MEVMHQLKGKRIAVLAADGFEKVELTVPVTALRLSRAEVDVISLRAGHIRGVNLHEPASRVKVDHTLSDVSPQDYDALLIPGGFINPDLLRQSAAAREFVRNFDASAKPIATLCHGPWVLASAGLTAGRQMTSWPGVRDDLVNAGAIWLDQPVVRDGNWLTSRGPQDMVPFVRELVPFFAGQAHTVAAEGTGGACGSSPQRETPPQPVLQAMKWLPRPSLRTLVLIGAFAVFYAARNRNHGPRGGPDRRHAE
ncbi:type 1 glutamine amidotransferase domain-containing protein [Comamonas endophytica]|uniref:Type 1 glutamine amidotransferase n=1 Tax=Comamonas endophytica TaxID=2949090 RepID=A0ABY6GAT0_9BURK|nr:MULTISPECIES: type 1 glutamine amidotransferase domain-containing protein [unclassified Acidovorax]MCD2513846.1 type 1 glutamine amidotransferase [Acidovorax sp. D4N7]UYG52153.1 type 1 glutamine amidotransferase [Acidovorax sp. 5MLIR]